MIAMMEVQVMTPLGGNAGCQHVPSVASGFLERHVFWTNARQFTYVKPKTFRK